MFHIIGWTPCGNLEQSTDEFRKWLNKKFELDLPTGKTLVKHMNKLT